MVRAILLLVGALTLAGCAPTPMPSTAYLPPGAFFSNADNDLMAINTAAWAWANPARTHGHLVNATLAVMAVEYLGGQLTSNPYWAWMSPLTKLNMLQARSEVRATIGIAADAPSQDVVNALMQFSRSPTEAIAAHTFMPPVFTAPPQEIVARLDNLPYLPLVARASYMASAQQFPGGNSFMFMP